MGIGAAIGVGLLTTVYESEQSNQQQQQADKEMTNQQNQEFALQNQQVAQQTQSMQTESNTAIRNKAMQGKPGDVSSLEGGTILTGALGIPSIPNNSNKTLLGM